MRLSRRRRRRLSLLLLLLLLLLLVVRRILILLLLVLILLVGRVALGLSGGAQRRGHRRRPGVLGQPNGRRARVDKVPRRRRRGGGVPRRRGRGDSDGDREPLRGRRRGRARDATARRHHLVVAAKVVNSKAAIFVKTGDHISGARRVETRRFQAMGLTDFNLYTAPPRRSGCSGRGCAAPRR